MVIRWHGQEPWRRPLHAPCATVGPNGAASYSAITACASTGANSAQDRSRLRLNAGHSSGSFVLWKANRAARRRGARPTILTYLPTTLCPFSTLPT
jgi:hypothetical protein